MNSSKIVLYTIDSRYCSEAKALLKSQGLDFLEIPVVSRDDHNNIKYKYPGVRTFPVIVIDDVWIGGLTNLMQWIQKT